MSIKKIFFKKFQIQKNSIRFYKYLFSYIILVLVIITIVGVMAYRSSIKVVQEEVENYNISELTQVKNIMDTRIREMDFLAIKIASNPQLSFSNLYDDGYQSYNAINEINKYKSSNFFIYDMLMFCSKKGEQQRIYSLETTWDIDMLFGLTHRFDKISKDEFIATTQSAKMPVLLSQVERNADTLMYIYPFNNYKISPVESIAFLIETKEIKKIMGGLLKNVTGSVAILDDNNNLLFELDNYNNSNTLKTLLNFKKSQSEVLSLSRAEIDNQNFTIIKMKSDYNMWSYIRIIPTDQFMQKATSIKVMFIYTFIIVLVLGLLIAYYFSNINYKPLKRFVEMSANLAIEENNNSSKKRDEINVIYETFDFVLKENQSLTSKLKSKDGMEREKLVNMLLHGKELSDKEKHSMDEILITQFSHENFVVFWGAIDDYKSFANNYPKEMQNAIKFGIINVLERLFKEIGIVGLGIEIFDGTGDGIALLANINFGIDKKEDLSNVSDRARNFVMENFGVTLTIGIGNTYDSYALVHKSFFEARSAVLYRFLKGKNKTLFFNEIEKNKNYFYPFEYEKEFIMAIKQGKQDVLKITLDNIFTGISENMTSPESAKKSCENLMTTLEKTIYELDMELSFSIEEELQELFSEQFDTIDSFKVAFVQLGKKICEIIEKSKESKNYKLREKIIEYIEGNFSDCNLSLNSIAEEFDMSTSYITRYFKDQTGYSLMHYIDTLKMSKVKELLKSTEMPLKQIIEHTGYVSDKTVISKFKKLEGVTPIQYRNITKGGNDADRSITTL